MVVFPLALASLEFCYLQFTLFNTQVAICSGADVVRPWSAMVTGIIAGFCLIFTKWLVLKLKVDDPLDATAGILFMVSHF